jgi:hypothetical protein
MTMLRNKHGLCNAIVVQSKFRKMPGFLCGNDLLSALVVIGFLMGLRGDRQRGSWSR